MSLLWVDGFESYGVTDGSAPIPTDIVSRQYTVNIESSMDIEEGRLGSGHCLELAHLSNYIQTPALTTDDTLIVGFAYKPSTHTDQSIVSLYDGSTMGVNVIYDSGLFTIQRGTTDLASGYFNMVTGNWYWIELKCLCDDAVGTVELRIGESVVASGTALDTKISTNAYHDIVRFGYAADYARCSIDDLYICDGSGAINNDFLGNVKVQTLLPDNVGNSSQFTPSIGSNYACMDDTPIDDDTSYVESSTVGHLDSYAYEAVAAGTTGIKGLMVSSCVRETDVTSYSVITPVRSGATDYNDSAQPIGTTDYTMIHRVVEQDPFTSAAWAETGINAAEFGIKVG